MTSLDANPFWYRVADLRAELRDHVQVHRHYYRGKLWYVIQDEVSQRYFRFGTRAYDFIRKLDGRHTIDQISEHIMPDSDGNSLSQDDIINLLADLYANDLIQCDVPPDTGEIFARHKKAHDARWKQYIKGPLLIRVPLVDPDMLLERLMWLTRWLFGRLGFSVWLLVVMLAGVMAMTHWPQIAQYWHERALAPHNLLFLVLTYPIVKGLHELAHGLATKRWGGEVHEMGVMFLVFMPLPYVDASSSTAFRDKHQRMLVGAAGILTELFLASLALFVWVSVETGAVRDIAYNVMLIGGISTLLFNGNPLLRFDGYYVLSDAIEIPNLGSRANRYYGYVFQRYLFGLENARSPVVAAGERGWFLFYGLASSVYRLFILFTIVLFLTAEYLIAGVILGIVAITQQIVLPIGKHLRFVLRSPVLRRHRLRAVVALSGSLAGIALVAVYVPLPASTYAQGVVWLPEHAEVRANANGFIDAVRAQPQSDVMAGAPLFQTNDPLIDAEVRYLEWELRELRARFVHHSVDDRVEAQVLQGQIERVDHELEQLREKAAKQTVTSPDGGTFLVAGARHLPGRFARKGDVLGYVTDLSTPLVRAVVRQDDISRVREFTRAVQVRLAERPGEILPATIKRQIPSATAELPSAALGTKGGGLIVVKPDDPTGKTANEQVFIVDIALPADSDLERVGSRAHIRFVHDRESLAGRLYRRVRQLLLGQLSV